MKLQIAGGGRCHADFDPSEILTNLLLGTFAQRHPGTVADMQDVNSPFTDSEENSVFVLPPTVEGFTDLPIEEPALWRNWAAFRE